MENNAFHLFKPLPAWRMGGGQRGSSATRGTNHPGGVLIHYYLASEPDSAASLTMKILEDDGDLIKAFSTHPDGIQEKLEAKKGFNRFSWNMYYPDAEKPDGMILWAANLRGPMALPGDYRVRLVFGSDSMETAFSIRKDPRTTSTNEALAKQFNFLIEVRDKVNETHQALEDIRDARKQMDQLKDKLNGQEDYEALVSTIDSVREKLTGVEETLYQTKNRSNQDPLNFPIRLNNKLAHLMYLSNVGDFEPTDQAIAFKEEVTAGIDRALGILSEIIARDIPALNATVREAGVDAIMVE